MTLGVGYSTDRQLLLTERCVNEIGVSFLDGPKSVLLFNGVSSYTEVARELGVDLSVHGKIDLRIISASVKGTVKFTNYVKETGYSQSFIFNINAQLPSHRLVLSRYGESALTDTAFKIYKTNPSKFYDMCGDQFVMQESRTASLYISTKLDFITRTEKNTFSIKGSKYLGTILDILRLGGDHIVSVITTFRISLAIVVLQKGGNIDELRSAVPELTIEATGFGTFGCTKSSDKDIEPELNRCKDVMNRLLGYASDRFPTSIDVNPNLVETADTYRMPYDTIGIKIDPYAPSEKVLQIRAHLKGLYNNLTSEQQFLNNLLYEVPVGKQYMNISGVQVGWNYTAIKPEFLAELQRANSTISRAITEIVNKDRMCYDSPAGCTDFMTNLNLSIVDVFQRSYIIRSNCNGTIYGPRYTLPIGDDLYKEDSVFQSSALIAVYKIVPTPDSITVSLDSGTSCEVRIERNSQYDLVDVYYSNFGGNCASKLCPVGTAGQVVGAEFISTETPI